MAQDYEAIGLAILVLLALVPPGLTLAAVLDWLKTRIMRTPRRRWLLRSAVVVDLVAVMCAVDAWMVEPNRLSVTRVSATSPKVSNELKIVHVSDIHFEHHKPLTAKLLQTIAEEKPNLIFLTGDVSQLGSYNHREFRQFLTRLCSIAPTYGVVGYDYEETLRRASSGKMHVMDGKPAEVVARGNKIRIAGASFWHDPSGETQSGARGLLRIVLAHSPDSIPLAVRLGADWYFCGHTHGGQVRLPIWGAIVTASDTGKRYEYGHYKVGGMEAFVTRGIGLEPRPAPQVRFLCPPEVVVLTIRRGNG